MCFNVMFVDVCQMDETEAADAFACEVGHDVVIIRELPLLLFIELTLIREGRKLVEKNLTI